MEHQDAIPTDNLPTRGPRHPWLWGGLALVALGGLGVVVASRLVQHAHVAEQARPQGGPRRLLVDHARRAVASQELSLPGSVLPAERAQINGMVSGVIREVRVNIGDHVTRGQLVAVIDAPEASAQLGVARARLRSSQENVGLVRQKATRVENLARSSISSQQDADTARLEANNAQASIDLNRAETQRYAALAAYQRVIAPFDGTVTRRLVDPGAVVSPGNTALLELATTQDLKISIDVPQLASSSIKVGDRLKVIDRNRRDPVEATVLRTAGALDATTRTLRAELSVSASSGLLVGSYVTVQVKMTPVAPGLLIPAAALASNATGLQVFVLGPGNRVQRRTVRVLRDLGREVELEGEVGDRDTVVLFPPVDLNHDDEIVPQEAPRKPAASASAPPAPSAPPAASR